MNLKYNAKLYGLLFVAAFLAAQLSLALHTSEHGVLEHSHAGEQCEHYVFSKHFNADTPSTINISTYFVEYKVSYLPNSATLLSKELPRSNHARAPPSILLS